MARLNVPRNGEKTHEGAPAKIINFEMQLRRSLMCCMLWEKTFYEDGVEIADRLKDLIPKVDSQKVAEMAVEARTKMKLRHAPLLVTREMARTETHKKLVADTLEKVIQRADELTEFLAIYWKDGKQKLSAQVKKGLARAFKKFDEYSLAKYNRDNAVKLRDVLFLCHAKPKDKDQEVLWKKLVDNELAIPDTWEVALSANDGVSKREKWERLLREKKLGALALLRNLRNMREEQVSENLIIDSIKTMKTERVLPFRFIAAAQYAPQWEPYLEEVMFKCLDGHEKLSGKTVLLVDVSGSMHDKLSAKSEMTRLDAACGLAMLLREICDRIEVVTFSNDAVHVPPRRGFALRDAIVQSQQHCATYLGKAITAIYNPRLSFNPDRLIVITDEQSHDRVPDPVVGKGYIINVASYKNGVGYGPWLHVDGWSEAIIDYVMEYEKFENR